MKRFEYKVVADEWGTGGIVRKTALHSVTIHHSAVRGSNNGAYSAEARAKAYAREHRNRGYPGISYQFFIPYDDSDIIYCTNYVSGHTWHNANYTGNQDSLAVLVDGNFQEENPHPKQLQKLKQLLDDIHDKWFSKNGWINFDAGIYPKDKNAIRTYQEGIRVPSLHYHNEVAQAGNKTACCGANLIPKVVEYRESAGNVGWGVPADPVTPPTDPCQIYKDQVSSLTKKKEELENQLGKVNADLENEQDAHLETTKQLEALKVEFADLQGKYNDANGKIPALNAEINKLNAELKECQENNTDNSEATNWLVNLVKKFLQWILRK